MAMVAWRTSEGVPGSRSTAFTHLASVKLVATVMSVLASIVPTGSEYSVSASVASGVPSDHCETACEGPGVLR